MIQRPDRLIVKFSMVGNKLKLIIIPFILILYVFLAIFNSHIILLSFRHLGVYPVLVILVNKLLELLGPRTDMSFHLLLLFVVH
jgi:hypothetical protein